MKVFILIVVMHVNSGGSIEFQEFTSLKNCNHAKNTIYAEGKRIGYIGLETAYCVAK